jgi:hypothetical protein
MQLILSTWCNSELFLANSYATRRIGVNFVTLDIDFILLKYGDTSGENRGYLTEEIVGLPYSIVY